MVSVIIPVYQVSDYVERCIRSVMAQTFTDIECIIVDDATQDDSIDKCERLIGEYNLKHYQPLNDRGRMTFKIIHHDINRGLSAARNTGTRVATGEYIFYLDSDDEITSDCIEKLTKVARKHPETEIVVGNTQVIDKGEPVRVWIKEETPCLLHGNETIAEFYHHRLIPNAAWNKLIICSFLEEHNLRFKEGIINEDILWMFYVMKYLSVVALVKDVTSYYHIRPGSISTSTDAKSEGISYSFIYDDMPHHLTSGREDKELSCYVNDFCKCYLRHKATIPAYKGLHKAYRKNAWKYGCWYVYIVLNVVAVISHFSNPVRILKKMNWVRWKLMGK